MKLVFGDPDLISIHHQLNNFNDGTLESIEGIIHHYGEFGKEIEFECICCTLLKKIKLTGENSKTECCGIIYNKKHRYGREIFLEKKN